MFDCCVVVVGAAMCVPFSCYTRQRWFLAQKQGRRIGCLLRRLPFSHVQSVCGKAPLPISTVTGSVAPVLSTLSLVLSLPSFKMMSVSPALAWITFTLTALYSDTARHLSIYKYRARFFFLSYYGGPQLTFIVNTSSPSFATSCRLRNK